MNIDQGLLIPCLLKSCLLTVHDPFLYLSHNMIDRTRICHTLLLKLLCSIPNAQQLLLSTMAAAEIEDEPCATSPLPS